MPASFRIYNTATRSTEEFVPSEEGRIKLYVCGMTVYDHAHVGHARAFVIFDAFVRWQRRQGWNVTFARNFTDVDDKIIRRANAEGVDPAELAERYIRSYHEDCVGLGLIEPDVEPRVSTSMPAIIAMIGRLVEDGHAYAAGGSVWFAVRTCPTYGALSNQDIESMQASEDDGIKRDHLDFALWKASKAGEPAWESPWGPGRPGWHIECSAMTKEVLGETVDIHGGGLDLVFPHHENEVAQSECANHRPYVRYWMHNGLLTMVQRTEHGNVLAAKMGKSLGNAFNIRDALRQYPAEALRVFYLQTHYRSPLPWSPEALPEALGMLARLYEARDVGLSMGGDGTPDAAAKDLGSDATQLLEVVRAFPQRFGDALRDDFNTSAALGHAFEVARALNRLGNHKAAKKRAGPIARLAVEALARLQVIGILCMSSAEFEEEVKVKRLSALGVERDRIEALVVARTAARAARDWARADAIRDQLDELKIGVMDRVDGADWKVRLD